MKHQGLFLRSGYVLRPFESHGCDYVECPEEAKTVEI